MRNKANLLKPKLLFGTRFRGPGILVGFLVLIFAFLPWITFSVGQGQMTSIDPNERVQSITASVDGFIGEWFVREGQMVKAGTVIVDLIDNDPQRLERLKSQKEAASEALASAEMMIKTAEINYHRQLSLFKQGLSSRKEFELAKIKVEKLNLDRTKNFSDLTKVETDLSRQSSQRIVAPREGIVTRILPGEKGQLIKSGTPIVIFTPVVKSPAVEVWVDGNDSAYLKKGMTAQIQFEGWPTLQIPGWPALAINTFKGKVHLVDQASSVNGKFRVLLTPDEKWPSQKLLRTGMSAKSYIKIRNSFVLREVWRILNGFPPLANPINDELHQILSTPSIPSVKKKEGSK